MKVDKNKTLICTSIKKDNINDLLEEIFQKMGAFNYCRCYMPENILLNPKDYMKIKKERSNVIIQKNNNNYILCMKIILDDKSIFPKKIKFKDKLKLNNMFPHLNRGENYNV